MSKSDIGMWVSICKTLVRREKVNRKVDDTYMHIIMVTHTGKFWVVRGTIVHHVGVMGIPQCTLCSAVPDCRRYILPLDLELASTGYRWDLKRVMNIDEYLEEGECNDVKSSPQYHVVHDFAAAEWSWERSWEVGDQLQVLNEP